MKNIITIQHTQSVHHINGMIGSHTDWDSSGLARARQTAAPVAERLGINPIFTQVLRERDLGEAVGKSVEWARENTIVWERTVDDRPFKGAETRREKWHSLAPFVEEIITCPDENIIIVSHGDTLSIINAIWIGLRPEDLNRCDLFGGAGEVSFFNLTAQGKRAIRRLGDMSFKA